MTVSLDYIHGRAERKRDGRRKRCKGAFGRDRIVYPINIPNGRPVEMFRSCKTSGPYTVRGVHRRLTWRDCYGCKRYGVWKGSWEVGDSIWDERTRILCAYNSGVGPFFCILGAILMEYMDRVNELRWSVKKKKRRHKLDLSKLRILWQYNFNCNRENKSL